MRERSNANYVGSDACNPPSFRSPHSAVAAQFAKRASKKPPRALRRLFYSARAPVTRRVAVPSTLGFWATDPERNHRRGEYFPRHTSVIAVRVAFRRGSALSNGAPRARRISLSPGGASGLSRMVRPPRYITSPMVPVSARCDYVQKHRPITIPAPRGPWGSRTIGESPESR